MSGWSALLGALGLVGVVFGLLSVLLLLLGAPTDLFWIGGNFALGFGLLLVAAVSGLEGIRSRLASGEAHRIGRFGTSAVLSTALGLAILGMLGFLATRYSARFDWSEAKVHSLSEQTRQVLADLETDVEVWAFYPPLDAQPVRELLERYRHASPRFRVEFADPNARPDLVERFGVSADRLGEGVVRVALAGESVELTQPDEEKLTNALIKLSRTGQKTVYFLEGHGERPFSGEGAEAETALSRGAEALRNENYRLEPLLLASRGEVPEDADVVVIAGPTRPLLPGEGQALARYLARGGALVALVDARAQTDFVGELRRWGVQLGDDVVVDLVQGLVGQAFSPLAREYADHPITSRLRDVTLFHTARSVRATPDAEERFTEIARTSENAWGETDFSARPSLDPGDLAGPVPLAVAGTPRLPGVGADAGSEPSAPPAGVSAAGDEGEADAPGSQREPRLVVFGDADFVSNQLIEVGLNRDLFVNAVNWSLGDVEAISIRPARSRASRFQLSEQQWNRIRYLSLFVLPEAIAIAGVVAWWSRRRAPGR